MSEDKARGGAELDPDAALGAAIIRLRERAGLARAELARMVELDPGEVAAIEAGGSEPTWGDLRRIAYALNVSLPDLLVEAEGLADRWDQ